MEKIVKNVKYRNEKQDFYDDEELEKDLQMVKSEYKKVSKLIDFFILSLLLLFLIEVVF